MIAVLKRFTSSIAATLLVLFLGVLWFALQSVGWASMLVTRSQSSNWTEAVRTTFDGQHPCAVCKVVTAGRAAEKKPSIAFKVTKLEVALTGDEVSVPPVPAIRRAQILDPVILKEDRSIPLPPPPRRAGSGTPTWLARHGPALGVFRAGRCRRLPGVLIFSCRNIPRLVIARGVSIPGRSSLPIRCPRSGSDPCPFPLSNLFSGVVSRSVPWLPDSSS